MLVKSRKEEEKHRRRKKVLIVTGEAEEGKESVDYGGRSRRGRRREKTYLKPEEKLCCLSLNFGEESREYRERHPMGLIEAILGAIQEDKGLLVYPPDHVIYGDYTYDIWDVEFIKYFLDFLRPENMRVDVVSKSFQNSDGFTWERGKTQGYTYNMLEENSGSDDFASSSQQTATPIQLYSKHMGGHMASQFLIPILSYRPTISS
uniref:Peptidase M16 middle/third domain-containing protein n=1 Tax=Solanum lycopersicum TaxID=4081 RepID=A0A3Q7EYB6_SOLLC